MRNRVNIGDRYRDSAILWNEWRVDRIFADQLGLPHAVMSNVADPTVTRTIACPTLSDPRRFKRVQGAAAQPGHVFPRVELAAELPA